jgi:glyoxylate reductase
MSALPRVFVSQPIPASALERLRQIANVTINPDSSKVIAKPKLIAGVRKADILFSLLHDKVDRAVLAANPKLRAVCTMAITPDNVDLKEATKRGIAVTVVPAVVTEATADLHMGLLLMVARRLVEGVTLARAGGFPGSQSNHLVGVAVSGKTIGLIGAGRIGQATARRARGFGMKVIYWAPRRKLEAEQEIGMEYVPFDRLLAEADFVSLHPALRPETRHMISDAQFAKMKPSAFIVNTSRGAVIDEKALIRALRKKKIAGAGLDVFEREPHIPAVLRKMKNVVIIAGGTPPNCVNPEVLKK